MIEFLQRLLAGLSSIVSFVFPLLLCGLFLLLLLLGRRGNLKREERWHHAVFPFLALVFGAAACIVLPLIDGRSKLLLDSEIIRPWIDKVLAWLHLSKVFDYGFLVYKVILINILLAVAYIIVKYSGIGLRKLYDLPIRLILWVIRKLKKQDGAGIEAAFQEKKKSLARKFVECFYQFDKDGKKAFIKPEFVKICKIFRLAAYLLMTAYLLLMIAVQIPVFRVSSWFPYEFFTNVLNVMYLYPVISLIVLFEIADFLDGAEPVLTENMQYDDDTEAKIVTDYKKAQKNLSETFPQRYIAGFPAPESVENSENTDSHYETNVTEQIRQFCLGKPGEKDRTTDAVPAPVRMEENTRVLHLIDSLEQGKDCLADASLFADLGDSFMVYLHLLLCRGENVLVLCADDTEVNNTSSFIEKRLHSINQFSPVWIIKTKYKATQAGDCDVLITTPTSLQDDSVRVGQGQFFKHVRLILVPNTVKMLISYAGAFSWLIHGFSDITPDESGAIVGNIVPPHPVSYLFLSQGFPQELENTLESMTRRKLTSHQCYCSVSNTLISLWNEESVKSPTKPQQRLFSNDPFTSYIGLMMPLALYSFKLTRTDILFLAERMPFGDIVSLLKQHGEQVKKYLKDENGLEAFESSLSFLGGFDEEQDPIVILQDEQRNLPLAVREASRYHGERGALVHIVSTPYLLRDFFQSKLKNGTDDLADNSGYFPLYIQSDSVRLNNLFSEFRQSTRIAEDKLLKSLSAIELLGIPKGAKLEEALRVFRDYVLGHPSEKSLQYDFVFDWEEVFNEKKAAFEYIRAVKLRGTDMKDKIESVDQEAELHCNGMALRLGFSANNVFQHYLPGQAVVNGGEMYVIDDIELGTGRLYASAAPEKLDSPTEFIQDRAYALTVPAMDEMESKWNAPSTHYGSTRLTAALLPGMRVCVETAGYYSILPYDPAVRPASLLYRELSADDMRLVRREFNGPVTVFRLNTQAEADPARASLLLAVVLQELCKTFFPYCWQEIAVCPIGEGADELVAGMPDLLKKLYPTLTAFPFRCAPREIGVLFIQDSAADNGIAQTLKNELQNPQSTLLHTALEYLEWLENGHIDSSCYLCYGEDQLPACFDLKGLVNALRQLPRPHAVSKVSLDDDFDGNCCCYCGRPLGARYFELKDSAGRNNRRICETCRKGLVKDKPELDRLYAQAVAYLTDTFGISLPTDMKVRFASARKIRRKAGTGDQRSVLGFAYIKKNEIWVETLAPKANILQVLVHELTHVWQNNALDFGETDEQTVKEYKEGHSSLMEVRYLTDTGRRVMAKHTLHGLQVRDDPYGIGFRRLLEELDDDYQHGNPFEHMKEKFPKAD